MEPARYFYADFRKRIRREAGFAEQKALKGFLRETRAGRSGFSKVFSLSGARRARPGGKHSPPANPPAEGYIRSLLI
jgi:hypothetical protein